MMYYMGGRIHLSAAVHAGTISRGLSEQAGIVLISGSGPKLKPICCRLFPHRRHPSVHKYAIITVQTATVSETDMNVATNNHYLLTNVNTNNWRQRKRRRGSFSLSLRCI